MEKIWNISPSTRMVLGRTIAPGKFIRVPPERMKNAHKIMGEVADGLLFVGAQLPPALLRAQNPAKAAFTLGAARAHGTVPVEAVSAEASAAVETKLVETVEDAPAVETTDDGSHYRRRGKRG